VGAPSSSSRKKTKLFAAAAAARARGNEINTARRSNALLTCRLTVFWIVNQKLPKSGELEKFLS